MPLKPSFFWGLRARFMLLAVALTCLFSSAWGIWTWQREKAQLRQNLSSQGVLLVSSMAIPIINALLYEELGIVEEGGLLDNFVTDIMANDQLCPLYAMVLDQDGRVLAHNRLSEYGSLYQDPLTRSALSAAGVVEGETLVDNQPAIDFAAPLAIGTKRWGCLRVGVSLAPLEATMASLKKGLLGFAGVFSAMALLLFYLVARRLSAPLVVLSRQMEAVQEGLRPTAPSAIRSDEIGQLQSSFFRMVDRLQKSERERQISQQRMLENEKLATIGMIVSGVAHEVNNPLAGILGALYHLERKGGAESGKYVSLISGEVERIRRIVGQLLDLSRSGAVESREMKSQAFFAGISLLAKMALKGRKVRLECKDLCTPKALWVDADKVNQVVLNLVLNAADASPENGLITLQAYDFDDNYCIRVDDSGPGVPPHLRKRIFEPFFTTKEPGRGSGLGLAICRNIAERHGGSLELDSSRNKGSGIIFRIPIAKPKNRKGATK
ncbi:two-component sensor histidine kinase [Desulfuromonas versatilis]|uniref:histidine kinase n=1 Tax=Desulfuromonas versatilis TaxID=2802975 RepID=A0ABM8HSU8_9BACT|nr:ATP-binding protein [Desulfuromonas versatilis]BCR03700.1 two-component sensor histidine kinase [Desulfuromonas versatilis]